MIWLVYGHYFRTGANGPLKDANLPLSINWDLRKHTPRAVSASNAQLKIYRFRPAFQLTTTVIVVPLSPTVAWKMKRLPSPVTQYPL